MKVEQQQRLYDALRRIAKEYMSPTQLRRSSQWLYGLEYDEALEVAYENIIAEARSALRGIRRPKSEEVSS